MVRRATVVVMALLGLLSACAPKTMPLPPAGVELFPDFVEPAAPPDLAGSGPAMQNTRAWRFLQAGDLRSAEREAAVALRQQPGFYPAQTTSAYIALARRDAKGAASQFGRVAEARPEYVPALVGKGLALQALEANAEAVEAYRAALKLDPSLADLGRRVDVLTLRGLQDELEKARRAARSGDAAAAMRAYRNAVAASPDSAFLYREMAALERGQGEHARAVEHLKRAHELDPSDPQALVLLGDILEQQGDLEGAMAAYSDAFALDADPAIEARRSALRGRLELAALPEQYRAIASAPQVTRADLAALIGVRLPALVQTAPVRDIGVVTDIRGQWAERWIAPVARAGIIEALPNHTFQPRGVVRRVDLAQAVSRLLNLVASQSARVQAWADARGRFTDMTPTHLAYPAASIAVAAGVLAPADDGAFQPTRLVTGPEAIDAIERVRRLASAGTTGASNRR